MPWSPGRTSTCSSVTHTRHRRGDDKVEGVSRREDGRQDDELRPVTITRGFTSHPAGSVLIEFGQTRVMCTASATEGCRAGARVLDLVG